MNKKTIIIIAMVAVIAIAAVLAVIFVPNMPVSGTFEEKIAAAETLVTEGKIKKAANTYESALKENPADINALKALSDLYVSEEEYGKATSAVRRAIASDEENVELYDMLMGMYHKSGDVLGFFGFADMIENQDIRDYCIETALDRKNANSLVMGNYAANHSNGGAITFSGDKVIYADPRSGGKLHILENGEKMMIASGSFTSVNAVGDSVYCIDRGDGNRIVRVALDGSEREYISDVSATNLMAIGNKLYFINWNDDSKPYSMDFDGKNLKKLSDYPTDIFCYNGKKLYINNQLEAGSTISIMLDGSDEKGVFMHLAHSVSGYDNILYFREHDTSAIWRVSEDGETVYDCLFEGRAAYVTATKDYVFFIDLDNDGAIMRMNTDGTEKKVLANDDATALSIDSDRLYYFNSNDDNKLYSVKIDGTERVCLG